MRKRKLGVTDLEFSTIGLGTWAIGGGDWVFGWGDQNEQDAVAGMHRAIELGVNWIDTAPVYGFGESEKLVGAALARLSAGDRPYVATKFGRVKQPDETVGANLTREHIFSECEQSLKNLQIEYIDLYQIHWPQPDEDIEEAWEACVELVQQGKVRQIGVCNHDVSQLRRLQAIHPVASLQPPYSMFARSIEDDLLPYCGEQNIGVIGYSPMAKGLLTGAFTKQRAEGLGENDHRSRDPNFSDPKLSVNLKFVDAIRPIAETHHRPLAQLSIAWVLRRSEMTAAITGVRKPAQIEQTIGAADWTLSEEEVTLIERALTEREHAIAVIDEQAAN